ncbi:hypothetical protein ACT4RV_07805, partial [Ornithobacterium rhinotracheale]
TFAVKGKSNAMTISETQNRIIKQVLNTENLSILNHIEMLLSSKTKHSTMDGKELNTQEYIQAIDEAIAEKECSSSEDVFKKIKDAYNLD